MTDTRKEKAERLIKYFETVTLPECPFKINPCTTVENVNTLIDINTVRLRHCDSKSQIFVNAYFHLYELKKFIENNLKPQS